MHAQFSNVPNSSQSVQHLLKSENGGWFLYAKVRLAELLNTNLIDLLKVGRIGLNLGALELVDD
jgi:hypothetical protein